MAIPWVPDARAVARAKTVESIVIVLSAWGKQPHADKTITLDSTVLTRATARAAARQLLELGEGDGGELKVRKLSSCLQPVWLCM